MSAPRRPLWLRLLLGAALLFVISLAVLAAFAWWNAGRLDRRIAAIRAAGDPASIADLKPAPIPDDKNAAAVLASLDDQLDAFAKDQGKFFKDPVGVEYEKTLADGKPPTADQLDAIRAILDKHAALAAGLTKAAACEAYASIGDYSLNSQKFLEAQLTRMTQLRTAARYLRWHMDVLTAEGQADQAVARGVEIMKLARLAESEPLLTFYLVTIAVRGGAAESLYDALSAGSISPQRRSELNAELAHIAKPGRLGRAVRTERAYSIDAFDDMANQSGPLGAPLGRLLLSRHRDGVLDYYDEILKIIDGPWYLSRAPFSTIGVRATTKFGPLAGSLVPALQAAFDAHHRDVAVVRSLRIFVALREFADANGRDASGMAEIKAPLYFTMDPFDGQPLRMKHTPAGWIVYSVHRDRKDDGGDFKGFKDAGVAPREHRDR
jgi:hypothetical protein